MLYKMARVSRETTNYRPTILSRVRMFSRATAFMVIQTKERNKVSTSSKVIAISTAQE